MASLPLRLYQIRCIALGGRACPLAAASPRITVLAINISAVKAQNCAERAEDGEPKQHSGYPRLPELAGQNRAASRRSADCAEDNGAIECN